VSEDVFVILACLSSLVSTLLLIVSCWLWCPALFAVLATLIAGGLFGLFVGYAVRMVLSV
jgi:hypothetical protein